MDALFMYQSFAADSRPPTHRNKKSGQTRPRAQIKLDIRWETA